MYILLFKTQKIQGEDKAPRNSQIILNAQSWLLPGRFGGGFDTRWSSAPHSSSKPPAPRGLKPVPPVPPSQLSLSQHQLCICHTQVCSRTIRMEPPGTGHREKKPPEMSSILPTPPSYQEEQLWSCFGGHLPYHSACPPCMRASSRAHSAGCTSGCSLPPRCRGAGCR